MATPTPGESSSRPALVLGGGGAYGVIQAAYMHAAYEHGFRPRVVVGTSVGSLNGAWLALHPDQPDELLRIWIGLDQMRLVRLNPFRLATRLVRNPMSLTTNNIVPELTANHIGDSRFEDTQLEFAVVATNLLRGAKHVFRSGPLAPAILASTAIPAVFEPVEIDGELFVDGCLTASVDMVTAAAMGATEMLAIDLTAPPGNSRPRTVYGVLKQSFAILSHATTDAMESYIAQQLPARVVRPDLSRNSPWRLDDSAGAVAHNLSLARRDLAGVFDADGHIALDCALDRHAAAAEKVVSMEQFFRVKRRAG